MRTLEDRLDQASAELRRGVAAMPTRPPSELSRRLNQRRTLSITTVLVIVLGSLAGTALLLTGDSGGSVASQPSSVTQGPTTTIPTRDDVGATAPLSTLPILGLDLPGWVAVDPTEEDGDDGGFRAISYYLAGEQGASLIVVKLRIRGIPEGSSHEGAVWWMNRSDFARVTIRGHDARMLESSEGDFEFGWRESGDAVVTLSVLSGLNTVTEERATEIASSIIDLDPELWEELLLLAPKDGVIPSSPTTTIAG